WSRVRARWAEMYPSWEIVEGHCAEGPWCKAAAVMDGARQAHGHLVVVAGAEWAIPHDQVHRLDRGATTDVVAGSWDPDHLKRVEQRPYRGHAGGGILVMPASSLDRVPPDPRFVSWGQEDDSWALALTTLVGRPWRGFSPLWHLWHPPQERLTRRVGNS